jgi:hypothetical protein
LRKSKIRATRTVMTTRATPGLTWTHSLSLLVALNWFA